jgi:hypothetical protein
MSYHRGEPYVWSDGSEMHLWSKLRDGNEAREYPCGVRIDTDVFDEIVVRRFLELAIDRRLPPGLAAAAIQAGEENILNSVREVRNADPI